MNSNKSKGNSTVLVLVIVIVLLAIAGIIFAGWYWYENYYKNSWQGNPSAITTQAATATTELNDSNSTFYHNIAYGYGINYPNSWKTQGAVQESDLAQFFTNTVDITNQGAIVSIFTVEDTGNIIDIKEWNKAQQNTQYFEKEGMAYLKDESKKNNSLSYYWICGFKVMDITYQTSVSDYNKYLPAFNAMFDTLIPCAE